MSGRPEVGPPFIHFSCWPHDGGYSWVARTPQGEEGGWKRELDDAYGSMRGALEELGFDQYVRSGQAVKGWAGSE